MKSEAEDCGGKRYCCSRGGLVDQEEDGRGGGDDSISRYRISGLVAAG
jgi:hypothetical protein